jgi:uncharacterized YigZ family protein
MTDHRLVPTREGRGEVREKASRFLAFAQGEESAERAAERIERLRREYHDATHVAFAWKIGSGDSAQHRASDAGEPSGTAGKPIASAIDAAGVTDVLVAVVRYFGGTKLGTGGLARAYREAASRALAAAGSRAVYDATEVVVTCAYESVGVVRRLLHPPEITLVEERFGAECHLRLAVFRSRLPALCALLEEARLSHRLEGRQPSAGKLEVR